MPQDRALFILTSEGGFSFETSLIGEPIGFSKAANFNAQKIINRSSPVITFTDSETINFTVPIPLIALNPDDWSAEDVNKFIKGCLSLTFPRQAGVLPPPLCYITIGSGLIFESYKAVCTNVDVQWGGKIYSDQGDAMTATVTLHFWGIELKAQDQDQFGGEAVKAYSMLSFE